jgi:hypothetical protein
MSKKTALIVLGFINFFALLGLWLGYDVINKIFDGIANSADTISINNRIGFFIFGIGIPIGYVFIIFARALSVHRQAIIPPPCLSLHPFSAVASMDTYTVGVPNEMERQNF